MRILVLTNMYPPHAYGGYELSCRDVVTRWRDRGHDVLVLTSDWRVPGVGPDSAGAPAAEGGVPVHRHLRLYWDDHRIVDPPPWRRLLLERANQASLRRALADHRPDVVSAWAMGALSMGLLTTVLEQGIALVPVVCDEWPVYGPVVDGWTRALSRRPVTARLVRRLTGLPTGLPALDAAGPACFVSATLRQGVRQRSPWTFPVAPVTFSGIEPAAFPWRGPAPAWSWRLLYVGRVDPRKGITTAVRALASCPPDATLAVVGRGDDQHLAHLRRLAADLGVDGRVSFEAVDRGELASRYAAADALLFTSTWEEPFGLVPLEAMACGTPVVATATGGAAEFLRDGGNCLAVPPDDPAALTAALRRLAGDAQLRDRLTAGGRHTAAALGVDQLADTLEHWHRWAVAPADGAVPTDRQLPPWPPEHPAPDRSTDSARHEATAAAPPATPPSTTGADR